MTCEAEPVNCIRLKPNESMEMLKETKSKHTSESYVLQYVKKCPKLLISIDSFFVKNIYRLIYYCNIRLPYRIRKIVRNISINILGHEGKKL